MCSNGAGACSQALLAAVMLASAVATADGHEFSQTEATIQVEGTSVRVRLGINLLELKGVDGNGDMRVSYDELDRAIERVFGSIKEHYTLGAPAPPARIVAERSEIFDDHVLQINLLYTFSDTVRTLQVTSTFDALLGPTHQHLATAMVNGQPIRAVLDASNPTMTVELRRVTTARILAVLAAAAGLLALAAYRMTARRRR
jgi:hypothetical protein